MWRYAVWQKYTDVLEAAHSSEMSVNIFNTAQHHIIAVKTSELTDIHIYGSGL
jgi:hypothetical protein